jgi:hypothetical protein
MKRLAIVLFLVILLVPAAALMAQGSNSVEVKKGTVVAVYGDKLVVKMANGETKEIAVPADFKFTVDGKPVGLAELKPGTELTAVITTTKAPQTVKTVQIKNGEVLKVAGNTVWFRHDGKYKSYQAPVGFKVDVGGKKVSINDLTPGTKLTAQFVYTTEKTLSEREVKVSGKAPAPPS